LKEATAQLAGRLSELRNTKTEEHPDVAKTRQQLDQVRALEEALRAQMRALDLRNNAVLSPCIEVPAARDRWWRRTSTVQSLGLTADQQKKMDDVFQQFRMKLIDSNAAVEKAEAALDPLVSAEPLDEGKVAAQIDRVADARAELEKTNGRMLLGLRKQLTAAQWAKLNAGVSGAGSVLEQALK
jgi:Spy/CpxP family protein refolding chaperone